MVCICGDDWNGPSRAAGLQRKSCHLNVEGKKNDVIDFY